MEYAVTAVHGEEGNTYRSNLRTQAELGSSIVAFRLCVRVAQFSNDTRRPSSRPTERYWNLDLLNFNDMSNVIIN